MKVYADYEEDAIYTGEYLSVRNQNKVLDEKFALSSFAAGIARPATAVPHWHGRYSQRVCSYDMAGTENTYVGTEWPVLRIRMVVRHGRY